MQRIRTILSGIVGLMALVLLAAPSAAQTPGGGFRALTGAQAASFQLPDDVVLVTSYITASGLTYERYQQQFGEAHADVLGGQLTLYRDASGQVTAVIGAHYPGILPTNRVNLTADQARSAAANDIGASGERLVNLQIDPASGRYFYEVDTRRFDSRFIHWINAGNGRVLNKFNALASDCSNTRMSVSAPCGYGVQYTEHDSDIKDLTALTTQSGSPHLLSTARLETHDQGSTNRPFYGPIASDADDNWTLLGDVSPAQQALVDAHYYANVADNYLKDLHNYDWVAAYGGKIVIHAHFMRNYSNAGWNGSSVIVGDGDGVDFQELTVLDVLGHELTHGVTEFTSDLIYQNESGALNEAFSDMMGTSMEYYADHNRLEPVATPDWLIGEDFDLRGGDDPGFRNMADPETDGDPSHYDERYTGTGDNGGVHINSGIANHWFYLLTEGGQNSDAGFASGTNVQGIGLAKAERIAFEGFTALQQNATFCDAREATIAAAEILYTATESASVADAWDEVGVDDALCGGSGAANQSPTADFTTAITDLDVSFTDASTDSDGSIVSWAWDFDDNGAASTSQNPSHTFSSAGTYSVTLTVTDDDNATNFVTKDVTVTSGEPSTIQLVIVDYAKNKGDRYAVLEWSGATSANVDIYNNGVQIATVSNSLGSYRDTGKGGGVYTYQVCEAGTNICSDPVSISY